MKKFLKYFLSKSKILNLLKIRQRNKIIIFNYHRIRDDRKSFHFDEAVYGPDVTRFKKELEWIKNETRVISEDELMEIVYNEKPVKEICSLVTFDDGYRDNFDLAYPILNELKIPAMFFIPTYNISERKLGWWDIVAFLFKNTKRSHFTFQNCYYEIHDRQKMGEKFILKIKGIEASTVNDFLVDLSKALEQDFPSDELQCNELMTWDQIKILSDNGMSIGTHSHDHSILSNQNNEVLSAQLQKSITILESVLNKKIKSIAYPVGGYKHFNDETKKVTKNLGLQLGFSYLTGVNQWGRIDPFDVKRISTQPEWINLDIPLAFPEFFINCENQ